jgi:hypothetical protein
MPSDERLEQIADLYNLIVSDLKNGELNSVLIKVHELQIEILRKKIGEEVTPIFFNYLKPYLNFTGCCIKFQLSSTSIFKILSDTCSV